MTQAEFKDIKITRGDETLLAVDLAKDAAGWKFSGGGNWKVVDGVLRQNANVEGAKALIADKRKWGDCTLTLKARKLSGAEGFLILFNQQNKTQKSWWNIGGWGNSRHSLEADGFTVPEVNGTIETGRWYDIKVELKGAGVKCYLDGKLVHESTQTAAKALYASATLSATGDEVILKTVNTAAQPLTTEINLSGIAGVDRKAKASVLSSADPMDENTVDQPTKVAPVELVLDNAAASFPYTFPGNSVSVIRLKIKK
jgi:alpha-L-arabinofuranosidase